MLRRCSGAIPYRFKAGCIEVLLVHSSSGDRWVFPKGGIEPELSAKENAIKETWEEAGAVGRISAFLSTQEFGLNRIEYFMMVVLALADVYPESPHRERCWAEVNAARSLLEPQYHVLIDQLLDNLTWS